MTIVSQIIMSGVYSIVATITDTATSAIVLLLYYYHSLFTGEQSDNESGESDGSDSEDDFVVVIPECFNLNVPLFSHSPHPHTLTQSCDDFELMIPPQESPPPTNGDITTRSCESPHTPAEPEHRNPPDATIDPKISSGASPRSGRRLFVPERVTLRGVKDARLRNPLTVATGLVNTVSDLVEGLTISGKKRREEGAAAQEKQQQQQQQQLPPTAEEEETFVVSGIPLVP